MFGTKSGYSSTVPARSDGGTHFGDGTSWQASVESHGVGQRSGSRLRSALVKAPRKRPVTGSTPITPNSWICVSIGASTSIKKKYEPGRKIVEPTVPEHWNS